MSAALQFPTIARAAAAQRRWQITGQPSQTEIKSPASHSASPEIVFGPARLLPGPLRANARAPESRKQPAGRPAPPPNLAFYRRHTQALLRRYLYASILVGRSPSIFTQPIDRGWASSRPVETFEDCVIFVLDMEKALARISALDRLLLTRVVLQEYTVAETALLLNKSHRIINLRVADAIDRLTEILLDNGTLEIPKPRPPRPSEDLDR
jgi:hypothetical protein